MNIRKRLYEIIETSSSSNKIGQIYDSFMIVIIVLSLLPLTFKEEAKALVTIDYITVGIFIVDYILRLITADYKLKSGITSFVKYPFTFMAIMDLLCIIPTFAGLSTSFKLLKIFRLFRTMRVFRTFKLVRYSKSITIILNVIKEQSAPLLTVGGLAIGYILISALIVFNVEPDTFTNFFDAIYWATISLTTMGYGDIYPVSTAGRCFTMLSSMVGIAIVALPAGIITAGYMTEITKEKEN